MADGFDDFLHRLIFRGIRAHRVDLHRISQLIAEVPRVDFLLIVIVAERGRSVKRISKLELLVHQFLRVQIERKSNLRISIRRRVDCIKHTAHDEHLTDHSMMHADVHAVHDVQSGFVDFRDDCVIWIGSGVNDPQAIVVGIKVNHIVLSGVQVVSAVDVFKNFTLCN